MAAGKQADGFGHGVITRSIHCEALINVCTENNLALEYSRYQAYIVEVIPDDYQVSLVECRSVRPLPCHIHTAKRMERKEQGE